jgi:hypothetical protein
MKKTILFLATFAGALTLGGCGAPSEPTGGYMEQHGRDGRDGRDDRHRYDTEQRRDGNYYPDDNPGEHVDPRRGS